MDINENDLFKEILKQVDFKNGIVQEITRSTDYPNYILDVCWKGNIHFIISMNNYGVFYFIEKNKEKLGVSYYAKKIDTQFFTNIQKLVEEINSGKFNHKKTYSQKVKEVIEKRQLVSYMNNTKWRELFHITEEVIEKHISFSCSYPCVMKTIFDEKEEWFNFKNEERNFEQLFKSIEWVKIQPKFFAEKARGRLIDNEKILHDFEKEFVENLNIYSIPYEVEDGIYTIYGYR